jgi:drug/metabolite transporter (DMT)-like permease
MSEAGPNLSLSQSHARSTRIALSALFGGAVGIGFAPIFVRLSELGPSATAFWRLALSLPPLWVWLAIEGQATVTPRRPCCVTDYRRLAVAGLFFAADLAVWHWSITLTSVANATLLANATPIFVTLAAWLWFEQRFTPTFILGMAAAMAGATILAGASLRLSLQHLLGDALGLLTAIFYAGYILAVKELRDEFSTATIMTWSGVVSAVALLAITLLSGEGLVAFTTRGWMVLVGLALVSHIGGQGLITYALAHLPAAFSSVGLLLQPAVAAMLAWIILDEPIGLLQALGGAIVLGGVVVARQGSRSARRD